MHWEVEQKLRIDDLQAIRNRLLKLGVQFHTAIEQVDSYFNHPSRDFATTDEALRLRQIGDQNFITYKGPKIDPATKTRRELELPLPRGTKIQAEFAASISALGFAPVGTVRKRRETGNLTPNEHDVEIAVDEVGG